MQYVTTEGTQGICQNGWHIPSDDEWKLLEANVDNQYGVGDPEWDGTGYRGFDAGKILKSTHGWQTNGNGTDLYGFAVLPGGYSVDDFFGDLSTSTNILSSTEQSNDLAWQRYLRYDYSEVARSHTPKILGASVRCLKDD